MPFISVTLVDAFNRTTKKLFEVEGQVDLATYGTVAQALMTDLAAVTALGVSRVDLIIEGIATGFSADPGSNVDVGATIQGYLAAGNGKKASIKVPGFYSTLVDPDGSIDLTGVVVAAYLANFETAGDFKVSDGETIDSWIKGTLDK